MIDKWDERFLRLAEHVALWSKDPSTKVGAVIVDDKRRIVGTGYNGFPRGVSDDAVRYHDRTVKYELVVHAEVNAILNAVKSTDGCTLYCTFHPCPRCAAVIIQSGIQHVIMMENPSDDRYKASQEIASQMFYEAGVEINIIKEFKHER